MKQRRYEMDMTTGSLPQKMLGYALPFVATGVLQLLFNAADMIVVGNLVSVDALAAVGSTSSLINLIINLFMGLSVGVSVLVSQYYGAERYSSVFETVHTAFCVSIISGVAIAAFGIIFAEPMLVAMGSPDSVRDDATLYLQIYFAGTPAVLLYNFLASVLRAVGDTRRPLAYLSISGVANVLLNLILVLLLPKEIGISGVGIATVVSQVISALLVCRCLHHTSECYHLDYKALKIYPDKLKSMIKIGLPAGIQGSLFSISNVIIQTNINFWGADVIAGNSAAQTIEGFTYVAMNSVAQTALAFVGQNIGARKAKNVRTIILWSCLFVTIIGIIFGGISYLLGKPLLRLFNPDATVIHYGLIRLLFICLPYFLAGLMDVLVGALRGMGYSLVPMLISVVGICGFRVLWIYTVYPNWRFLETIYISYPITWILTLLIQALCLIIILNKMIRRENLLKARITK